MSREQVTIGAVVDIGGSAKSLNDLKGIIEDAKIALQGLDGGSKEYKDTLEKLASAQEEYNDVLKATKASQENMGSTIEGITNVTNGMMGGFQALNGVLALTGSENKNLVETLVKLKAVSSVVQGFKQFTDAIRAGNIAFKLFNITVKSNPLMLLATSIITVIALVKEFTSSLDEANDTAEKLEDININAREHNKEFNSQLKNIKTAIKTKIELAKEEGKTEEEINKIILDGRKDILAFYDKNTDKLKENLDYDLLNIAKHNTDKVVLYEQYYKKLEQARNYYNDLIAKAEYTLERSETEAGKNKAKAEISRLKEKKAAVQKYFEEGNTDALKSINFYKNGYLDITLFNDQVGKSIIKQMGSDFKASITLRDNYNKNLVENEKAKNKEVSDFNNEDRLLEAKKDRKAREQKEAEEQKARDNELKEIEKNNQKKAALHQSLIDQALNKENELLKTKQLNDQNYDRVSEELTLRQFKNKQDYYNYIDAKAKDTSDYVAFLQEQLNSVDLTVSDDLLKSDPVEANRRYAEQLRLTNDIGEKLMDIKQMEIESYELEQEMFETEKDNALQMSAIEKDKIDAREAARQAGLAYQDMDTQLEQFEQEQSINQAKAEMFLELANDEKNSWEIRAEAIQSYDEYNKKSLQAFVNAENTKKQLSDRRKQIEKSAFNSTRTITYNTMDILNESIGNSKAGAIAKTTIDTYASATEAYRSQLPLGPKGPILGGLAAAAAITAGLKNVKSILKTKTPGNKGGGGSGGGIEQPDYLDNNPQITEQFVKMTSDDIDEINKSSRVYVVESDISNTQNKVKTTEGQATF